MNTQRIIVNGVLEHNGAVLLAKRAKTKKIAPGLWHLPGGHVEYGESPADAIVREFSEELRLNVTIIDIIHAFSYVENDTHTVGISYRLSCDAIPSKIWHDPSDNEQVQWVPLNDVASYWSERDDHDQATISLVETVARAL